MKCDMKKLKADKSIDARKLACPGPLFEADKGLQMIMKGQTLEILTSDQTTKVDMIEWCQEKGQEYLGFLEQDGYDRIFIKKTK
jgi:tRNA 2-thiouridine synthesizing protein A